MNVEVYTKSDCVYCQHAKALLLSQNIPYSEYKLGFDFTRETILEKFTSAKSFPIIVVDGFYIGGYTQLKEYVESQSSSARLLNEDI